MSKSLLLVKQSSEGKGFIKTDKKLSFVIVPNGKASSQHDKSTKDH